MFQDSVGSTVLLSLIDMTVVFVVLAFLMVVVYVTYFFVGRVKEAPPPPTAPSADELEIVAVQAAALSAHQETQQDYAKPAPSSSDSLWKRTWFWNNTKPNSR